MDWIDIRSSQPLQKQNCVFYAPNLEVSERIFTAVWEHITVGSTAYLLSGYFPEGYMGNPGITHWLPLPSLPSK